MDSLDLEILRLMYRGGRFGYGGVDPRVSFQSIAEKAGIGRRTVAARIREWRREGFLSGSYASPHLRALGCGRLYVEFSVLNEREARSVMDRLELVDGLLRAEMYCDGIEGGRTLNGLAVELVKDHPVSVERRLRLLREVIPSKRYVGPVEHVVSEPPPELSILDWRILGSFVEHPDMELGARASSLKVTGKTLSRRLDRLIETGCLECDLLLDWSRSPTTAIGIFYGRDSDLAGVQRELRSRFRFFLDAFFAIAPPAMPTPKTRPWKFAWVVVPTAAPTEVYRLVDDLKSLAGVLDARPDYWGATRFYPSWFIQHISDKIAGL